jgi:hypothetical protein
MHSHFRRGQKPQLHLLHSAMLFQGIIRGKSNSAASETSLGETISIVGRPTDVLARLLDRCAKLLVNSADDDFLTDYMNWAGRYEAPFSKA